ncbi:hypothetical protein DPSP01_013744 [Paraphaeosphaeria sporulosa]|uniref:Hydrophobin n=1 Tax=Paraphaeosphaeria sporulosa TaxID=1460663 RepID=A0A177BVW1_9PLEO|nr:uncharacterized protein CC84DRAFT_1169622 [Paraphaeosphaeria sporulosa]OAF98871.1 hypothetical protein CC84DRAFT_1169622 [Paraphaeosphaeria sporulosa]
MKYSFAIPALATLFLSVQATPAAVPELHGLESRAVVSCTVNGGPTASCCTGSLTRYGCATTNTNQCSPVGTTPCGSIVQIYCYQFGEAVNGNSMWYRLNPTSNGMMPASFFSSCTGISPC